jgi:hypothetical protein
MWPKQPKDTPADSLFLLIREACPAKRASRIRFQRFSKWKLGVLLNELDAKLNTGEVAGLNPIDDLHHHRIDPSPSSLRMLHWGKVTWDDAYLRDVTGISPKNLNAAPAPVVAHASRQRLAPAFNATGTWRHN